MQPAAGGGATARPPLTIPGTSEAIAWYFQARHLGLVTAEHPSQNPHLHVPCGGGKGLQRPTAGAAAPRQHVHAGHAVPCLRRPSPSLRCAGDQRPHVPAAAAPLQRPQCLSAPGHWHGQKAGRQPLPDSSGARGGRGAAAYAHAQRSANHTPRTRAQDT
eukprot:364159-Chlamydomonas_euryale.AAC.6